MTDHPRQLPLPAPVSLKGDAEALEIAWSDGVTHRLTWRMLRDSCPCAVCRVEREKPPQPAPAGLLPVLSLAEAQPLRAARMRPVGNYAYAIEFTDGHNSGIYALEYLRALGEAATGTNNRAGNA